MINALAIGFGVGINAVISYHLGAGEIDRADAAATRGIACSVIHGVVSMTCASPSCRVSCGCSRIPSR
ncbi:MAG: hypothetical protein ACLT4C_05415 [Butyricicoccus sp.]